MGFNPARLQVHCYIADKKNCLLRVLMFISPKISVTTNYKTIIVSFPNDKICNVLIVSGVQLQRHIFNLCDP